MQELERLRAARGATYEEASVLERYVLNYYRHLATALEQRALDAIVAEEMASRADGAAAEAIRARWAQDPAVAELLSAGAAGFRTSLAARLLAAHADKIPIHRCPECGRAVHAPRSTQCTWCFHAWTDAANEVRAGGGSRGLPS